MLGWEENLAINSLSFKHICTDRPGLAKYEGQVAHQETEFYEKAGRGRGGKVKYRNTSRLCQQGYLTITEQCRYLETVYETNFTGEVRFLGQHSKEDSD